jgi:FAD/FMN-containing dehydrogenase
MTHRVIQNFGRNLRFQPQQICTPKTEHEVLTILRDRGHGKIRVIGSRHAWSGGIVTDDTLIDLRYFNQVQIQEANSTVTVGAGCQLKRILRILNQHGLTLPSVGLITEQTIAGVIATGTHGSGKHSLSHYVMALRVACFDANGNPQIVEISEGVDLQAARCGLGCLGVVLSVTLPCIPQYYIQEKATPCAAIAQALALEDQSPLQQFFLFPHAWVFMAQERRVADQPCRSGGAWVYRMYWFVVLDLGLHLLIKVSASVLRRRGWIHQLFRNILPAFVFPSWVVVDRSDRMLTMRHELFHHFEMELFVQRSQIVEATQFLTDILRVADDAAYPLSAVTQTQLESMGLLNQLNAIRGTFTHHYPICFRRVLPDDTLMSMTSGSLEDWYSISLITYVEPRDDFRAVASFLAKGFFERFQARIHWGKWFPHTAREVEQLYPRLAEFQAVCRRYDPKGVFQNPFVRETFGDRVLQQSGES